MSGRERRHFFSPVPFPRTASDCPRPQASTAPTAPTTFDATTAGATAAGASASVLRGKVNSEFGRTAKEKSGVEAGRLGEEAVQLQAHEASVHAC